jgi:acyl-CoA reductase-like NAD-dependent aldehyde dehydrogenase
MQEDDTRLIAKEAVDEAVAAQPGWASLGFSERARMLRTLAARLRTDEELAGLISAETGKPAFEAFGFEILYVCEIVRFLTGRQGRAAIAAGRRGSLIFPHKRARVLWQPRGLVAVLGPSNFPLLNNFGDAVAPLLAGNSVVLKPSPQTPRTSLRVQVIWREMGLPEGAFQVVQGGSEVGTALVDTCDMVFFTGSISAGRKIAARAGERLIPCVAELGGKSAMIVLANADLRAAARAAVWGAFAGAGQVCIRPERVFVEASVADDFVGLVAAEMGKLRIGADGDFDVGRVQLPAQMERYRAQVDDAVERGARLVLGGKARTDLGKLFFEPTVLDRVSPESLVAREETFGPVLPIIRVANADEAVRLTNASTLGLSGSVWSRDSATAAAVAKRLVTGSVCINDVLINYFFVGAPLGAAKGAGLGFRHGAEVLRQFCYPQTIVEDRPGMGLWANWIRKQIGFPYRKGVLDVLRRLARVVYR